jgi:thymidine phosphorylase
VGNALEIRECLELLRGTGPADLTDLVTRLATRMVVLAGRQPDAPSATAVVQAALASGAALDVFRRMVERQGGNPRVVDDPSLLPAAPSVSLVRATRTGRVRHLHAGAIGRASHALGAGRSKAGESVDLAVGVRLCVERGDAITAGEPVVEIHHRDGRGLERATALCLEAVVVEDDAPAASGRIIGEVR